MNGENDGDFEGVMESPHCKQTFQERTPKEIEREVSKVTSTSNLEDLCAMLDAADWLLARAKSINEVVKQKAIEWIEANGEFDIGVMHYSVGHYTTIRCTNTKKCGHALLNHFGGDFDGFLNVLVAQPYKSTFARRNLPQPIYSKLFKATTNTHLISGRPTKTLKRADNRFLR